VRSEREEVADDVSNQETENVEGGEAELERIPPEQWFPHPQSDYIEWMDRPEPEYMTPEEFKAYEAETGEEPEGEAEEPEGE
jgi:hypothetical protein